jgi:hypothetical protein
LAVKMLDAYKESKGSDLFKLIFGYLFLKTTQTSVI